MESITKELREWFESGYVHEYYGDGDGDFKKVTTPWFGWRIVIEDMLDHIDTAHEKQCEIEYAKGVMSVPIAVDESQWVKLPVDADGVPWYRGSRVIDPKDPESNVYTVWIAGDNTLITDDHLFIFDANKLRHYHEPTVEDVLDEMLQRFAEDNYEGGLTDFIASYATKLQLKEG